MKRREWDFFDKKKNIRLLWRGLMAVLAILVGLDFLIEKHAAFTWSMTPGFYAAYGFISCVAIVLFSNLLGKWLKRKEGYYD